VTAVIPPITVLGTAAAVLAALWPGGAHLLIRFTGPELWWLLGVAHSAGELPGAAVPVPSRLMGFLTVAAGGVAAVFLWRRLHRSRWVRPAFMFALLTSTAWVVASVGHGTIVG
jgi:competence protein ComEC